MGVMGACPISNGCNMDVQCLIAVCVGGGGGGGEGSGRYRVVVVVARTVFKKIK